MTQTPQGMGFGKEGKESEEEKQRRPGVGGLHVEGPGCRRNVYGNSCLGKGSRRAKQGSDEWCLPIWLHQGSIKISELTMVMKSYLLVVLQQGKGVQTFVA